MEQGKYSHLPMKPQRFAPRRCTYRRKSRLVNDRAGLGDTYPTFSTQRLAAGLSSILAKSPPGKPLSGSGLSQTFTLSTLSWFN